MKKNDPEATQSWLSECSRILQSHTEVLRGLNIDAADRAQKYLLFTNAGAAVATLGVLCFDTTVRGNKVLWWALSLFSFGVLLCGILTAINYQTTSKNLTTWIRAGDLFDSAEIDFESVPQQFNQQLQKSRWLAPAAGYLAFLSLIAGGVTALSVLASRVPNASLPEVAPVVGTVQPAGGERPKDSKVSNDTVDANRVLLESTQQHASGAIWTTGDKIAAIAGIAGVMQFFALLATWYVMRKTAVQQLRAYVHQDSLGLYEGSITTPPQENRVNVPGIVLVTKNFGQTPAYNLVTWAGISVIDPINEDRLVAPELQDVFKLTLPAQGPTTKTLWFDRTLTAHEIADLNSGAKRIYVHGRCEYLDVYKRKRHTNFRLVYRGPFPPTAPGAGFNFCQRGNEAN